MMQPIAVHNKDEEKLYQIVFTVACKNPENECL